MHFLVAGVAEAHQVIFLAAPAFRQRHDVVHLLRLHVPSFKKAAFAERMLMDVAVPDPLPGPAVPFPGGVAAGERVVMTLHHLFMLLAVGVVRQPRASWVAAGPLGFSWHGFSFRAKENLAREFPYEAALS
jgi:hypothetical protein